MAVDGVVSQPETPLDGVPLSSSDKRILAALSRRPRGLLGVGSVALASGVADEEEARVSLAGLERRGLVTSEQETIRWSSPPRHETLWRLELDSKWFEVAAQTRTVVLPDLDPEPMPDRLPPRFRHLFWWGDPSSIELPRDAAFVAEHLLACDDIAAWGWVLTVLPYQALERVAAKDRTPADTRAMILNALARRDEASV